MPTLDIKDSDIGDDPELRRIAEALKADATPEQVNAGWKIWNANKGSDDLSLEAGLLRWGGAEYPVLGVRFEGELAQYITGKSCRDFFTKGASPGDLYTPGPAVTITED